MKVAQKVSEIQKDLAKLAGICNDAGQYQIATIAQGCLRQVAGMSTRLATKENEELASKRF